MNIRTALIASTLLTAGLASSAARAALQGRDLDGNVATFEAYYDTVLDITWLADANYANTSGHDADGLMNWTDANAWAANLSFTDGVNFYDNWRLPTVEPVNGTSFNPATSFIGTTDDGYNITSPQSEMSYMFFVNLGNPSYFTLAGTVSGCYVDSSNTCLNNVGPFSNIQPYRYWSATEYAPDAVPYAQFFHMGVGGQSATYKLYDFYAWAVSPGDVAAVPEAQTYALMLAGLGLVGWRARRRG